MSFNLPLEKFDTHINISKKETEKAKKYADERKQYLSVQILSFGKYFVKFLKCAKNVSLKKKFNSFFFLP